MTNDVEAAFAKLKSLAKQNELDLQAEPPAPELQGASEEKQVPRTGRPGITDLTKEKLEVLMILSRWQSSANLAHKKTAETDCKRIIGFINKICAW